MRTLPGFTNEELATEEEFVEKAKKYSPFEFINSINYEKTDLMADGHESDYTAYIVNRGLGFGADTVIAANEMNSRPHIDSKMQYDFLRGVIRKAKRYNKWLKSEEEDLDAIKEYFGYSYEKAKDALKLLSHEQVAEIKTYLATCKGGKL